MTPVGHLHFIPPGVLRLDRTAWMEPFAASHAEQLTRLIIPNRLHLAEWLPWMASMRGPAEVRNFLEFSMRTSYEGRGVQCGVWTDDAMVGVVGLHTVDWTNRSTALGYWFGREGQGRGLARRAAGVLVAHAFTKLDLNRVEIRCAEENYRSRRIPAALGFVQEGVLHEAERLGDHYVNHVVYGVTRTMWSTAMMTGGA